MRRGARRQRGRMVGLPRSARRGVSKGLAAAAIIVVIVIVAAAALMMGGGGGQAATTTTTSPGATGPAATTTTTQAPQAKPRTVVIGVTDKVTDLDPAKAYDFFTWEVLSNVMAGLVKYDPKTGDIVGDLATSWETQEDGKVWIFHLRKDAKFADGTPCTAKDVVRSINRVMKINSDPAWLVTDFVEKVEALDDYTVKFTLKKPVGYFLAVAATVPYYPVHPNYPEDKVASDATWGGCGPYKIVEFVRDERLVLEPNPYYYGEKPKNDKVVILFYKNAQALKSALEAGDIDIAWRTLNPEDINDLKNKGYNVIEVPGLFIRYIVVKTDAPPTDNKLVRQALAAAIDRKEIAQVVYQGTVEPLYSLVPSTMWSYKPVFKEKYGDGNIELAKQLLQQAGYSEDNPLHVELWYTPTHYGDTEADLAALIAQQWERTGMIKVDVKSSEWGQFVDQLSSGQFMLSLLGWYPDYLDPDNYLTPFLKSTANSWTGTGYKNPKVDQLLEQASTLTDKNERARLYEQVQEILAEDVPFIPLVQGKLYVVTGDKVQSLTVSPLMFLIYASIEVSG